MNISQYIANTPITKEFLGYGEIAIHNTVDKINQIVKVSAFNPYVRKFTESVISDLAPNDKMGELRAIHDFVKYKVRYTKDPYGMEYIQTPPLLLKQIEMKEQPAGDCDDMSTLTLSMMKSVGYPVATKITSYSPNKKFSHIYGLVFVDGRWIPTDTTLRSKQLGWEAPNITRMSEKEVR